MKKNNFQDQAQFVLRYARQLAIPEIGKTGQIKISQSKVLIIGCGALGSMIAMQLGGAGVGTIGIADFDNIEISNLHRQFFYSTDEAGKSKVEMLHDKILSLNPTINVVIYKSLVQEKLALKIFQEYDFIIDATDNPDSKYLIDRISKESNVPCCIGGVQDFSGQIITILPSDKRFHEIFGKRTSSGILPCSLNGVLGPAAALCASIQACEAIKFICRTGEILSGRLLTFNLLYNKFIVFNL